MHQAYFAFLLWFLNLPIEFSDSLLFALQMPCTETFSNAQLLLPCCLRVYLNLSFGYINHHIASQRAMPPAMLPLPGSVINALSHTNDLDNFQVVSICRYHTVLHMFQPTVQRWLEHLSGPITLALLIVKKTKKLKLKGVPKIETNDTLSEAFQPCALNISRFKNYVGILDNKFNYFLNVFPALIVG